MNNNIRVIKLQDIDVAKIRVLPKNGNNVAPISYDDDDLLVIQIGSEEKPYAVKYGIERWDGGKFRKVTSSGDSAWLAEGAMQKLQVAIEVADEDVDKLKEIQAALEEKADSTIKMPLYDRDGDGGKVQPKVVCVRNKGSAHLTCKARIEPPTEDVFETMAKGVDGMYLLKVDGLWMDTQNVSLRCVLTAARVHPRINVYDVDFI